MNRINSIKYGELPRESKSDIMGDRISFFIGFFSYFQFRALGIWSVGEIILLLYGILSLNLGYGLKNKTFSRVFLLFFVYFIVLVCVDFYQGTHWESSLKELGNLFLFMLGLCAGYTLFSRNVNRFLYYTLGAAISWPCAIWVLPPLTAGVEEGAIGVVGDQWLVYLLLNVFLAIFAWTYYVGKKKFALILGGTFAVLTLLGGSRNGFLVMSLATSVVFIAQGNDWQIKRRILKFRQSFVLIALGGILALAGVKYSYEYMAEAGWLGEDAQEKYYNQTESSLGIIGGSRLGFFLGAYAIYEEYFFVGAGSRPLDTEGIRLRFANFADIQDKRSLDALVEGTTLGTHSCVMSAGVQAGILGMLPWLYLLYLIFMSFFRGDWFRYPRLVALSAFLIVGLLWNILFSAFGGRINYIVPVLLLIIMSTKYRNYTIRSLNC